MIQRIRKTVWVFASGPEQTGFASSGSISAVSEIFKVVGLGFLLVLILVKHCSRRRAESAALEVLGFASDPVVEVVEALDQVFVALAQLEVHIGFEIEIVNRIREIEARSAGHSVVGVAEEAAGFERSELPGDIDIDYVRQKRQKFEAY